MPFQMKIQPIDDFNRAEEGARYELVKPVMKSKLKRLFERQFQRNSSEKESSGEGLCEFEPSSLCLAKMVQNFIEDNNEKQLTSSKCGRNRCNCFNGNYTDSSEEEFDDDESSGFYDPWELLKSLVPCSSVDERNILADTARIVENNNKVCKRKDDLARRIVTDGLLALGYDASICKSHWDKSPSFPAGDYEYIDVIISGERLLIDIDFRSEFEIARSTKSYKSVLQIIPFIFVGKPDRLQKIISIVSKAAKQSLKKKGMPVPPWRKADYVKAKWLSPHIRATSVSVLDPSPESKNPIGPFEFNIEKPMQPEELEGPEFGSFVTSGVEEKKADIVVKESKTQELKLKSSSFGARSLKIVTGLASVIEN